MRASLAHVPGLPGHRGLCEDWPGKPGMWAEGFRGLSTTLGVLRSQAHIPAGRPSACNNYREPRTRQWETQILLVSRGRAREFGARVGRGEVKNAFFKS